VLIDKISKDRTSLSQEVDSLQAEQAIEVPNTDDIVETVKSALSEEYQSSIAKCELAFWLFSLKLEHLFLVHHSYFRFKGAAISLECQLPSVSPCQISLIVWFLCQLPLDHRTINGTPPRLLSHSNITFCT
jgi:hypothetical protein